MSAVSLIRHMPDFDMQSAKPGVCFIRNIPKQPKEGGVFRCGNIDEERGWLDISEGAVEEMAHMLGWVHADKADALKDELEKVKLDLREALRKVDKSRIDTVIEISTKADSANRKARRYKKKFEDLQELYHNETGKVAGPILSDEDESLNDTIQMPKVLEE